MSAFGLPALASVATGSGGGQAGGGLPGFDNSSSAESRSGPITVGGLQFAPARDDTLTTAILIGGAVILAFTALRRR